MVACEIGRGRPRHRSHRSARPLGTLTRYVLGFPASVALSREEIVDWLGPTIQR
jgi:hypothetical protein